MILTSLATATPPYQYKQPECLTAMREADFWPQLAPRSQTILEKVLSSRQSGIDSRSFCLPDLQQAWSKNAQGLNEYFEQEAPKLAVAAANKAIADAQLDIGEIDALMVTTCTGYLCPGLSSHIAEQLGLKPNAYHQDLTGYGCGAAIPMLQMADGYLHAQPAGARVLTICVEICSAAFYVEDDFGVLISTCLFGDGAAAAIWTKQQAGGLNFSNFQSIHHPAGRELIRFTNANGQLRNQLDRKVPGLVGETAAQIYQQRSFDPDHHITHGGGRDVIEALEAVLPVDQLEPAREVMRHHGNLSSPSVLFALKYQLDRNPQSDRLWLCTFGAGFSMHSCEAVRC
ncbi:type III polyketide synthase [Persicirhabdus sediminis]|uniref:Stilbene synthase n=1 Tax=Persicirhabdus sediminis TaxID=454144 RepID=A0A8J7MBA2_9BACT|nr:stilbene synthase [Persicirhabdus sediminis]MBK1790262.1 stilbene synthase [Persicirhabdus sediminis]